MTGIVAAAPRLALHAAVAADKCCRVVTDSFFIDRPSGFGRYLRDLIEAVDRHAPTVDLVVAVRRQAA